MPRLIPCRLASVCPGTIAFLWGLYIAGLQAVTADNNHGGTAAPIDALSAGSSLSAALVGSAEIAAAAARVIEMPSMQALADKMLPDLYIPLSEFAGQLYA